MDNTCSLESGMKILALIYVKEETCEVTYGLANRTMTEVIRQDGTKRMVAATDIAKVLE